jgi:hypothetical protein
MTQPTMNAFLSSFQGAFLVDLVNAFAIMEVDKRVRESEKLHCDVLMRKWIISG